MVNDNKWLFLGQIHHQRHSPRVHKLKHRAFYLKFPLSRVAELSNPIFSVNHWNIFSFHNIDHGDRKGGDLWLWANMQLRGAGIFQFPSEIYLQTFPRFMGYVFNPVSFWHCYSGSECIGIIAEVNNTFGDTHSYVIKGDSEQIQKELHVSPFYKVDGSYRFNFSDHKQQQVSHISYSKAGETQLTASISGYAIPWTTRNLLAAWSTTPLMSFGSILLIHLHAIILFLKGIPFYGKNGEPEAK